jgi:hypothetical protein
MKLGTLKYIAIAAVAGSLAVSMASSREQAPAPAPANAPAAKDAPKLDNLQQMLAVFRSDLSASKVNTLNRVMKLTPAEAAKFWPIYQQYEKELMAVGDRRIALIKQFVTLSNEGKLTDANAGTLSAEWLQGEQDRLDLWKKYNKEISAAVSPIRAAQFLQVEHQIALLVDINIASEMPAVGSAK